MRPGRIWARRRSRCRCCPMTAFMCWKCPAICWNESSTLRFDVAAMLNLSPDHLDRHGDMEGYVAAKRQIFARQDAGCTAVIGMDDRAFPRDGGLAGHAAGASRADFGRGGCRRARRGRCRGRITRRTPRRPPPWRGRWACRRRPLPRAIATFPGLPHRQQEVAVRDGVRFINDSKATNADAAVAGHGLLRRGSSGSPAASAKAGGIEDLAPLFPAHRKGVSDRPGRAGICRRP